MTDHSKGFVSMPYGFDRREGMKRLDDTSGRVASIKSQATPHVEMQAASVAPARGPQHLEPNFSVTGGGIRRMEGAHWRALSPLAAAVAQARIRYEARDGDKPFVPPYGPGQVAMAEFYAALTEWRNGSALRCSSFEAGREGGGSGHFIDTFIQRGLDLGQLHQRIGNGVAMTARRNMDRGNSRRTISVRAVVDMVCIGGQDLTQVLRRFGWEGNGRHRAELRKAICSALDRMQGYPDKDRAK